MKVHTRKKEKKGIKIVFFLISFCPFPVEKDMQNYSNIFPRKNGESLLHFVYFYFELRNKVKSLKVGFVSTNAYKHAYM